MIVTVDDTVQSIKCCKLCQLLSASYLHLGNTNIGITPTKRVQII